MGLLRRCLGRVGLRHKWPFGRDKVNLVSASLDAHIGSQDHNAERAMQTRNKFMDDMSQLMTNAMGVAQGAKDEADNAMKSLMDRWLADRDFVTREEFDAVRAMAQKAREENEALKARLDAMDAK